MNKRISLCIALLLLLSGCASTSNEKGEKKPEQVKAHSSTENVKQETDTKSSIEHEIDYSIFEKPYRGENFLDKNKIDLFYHDSVHSDYDISSIDSEKNKPVATDMDNRELRNAMEYNRIIENINLWSTIRITTTYEYWNKENRYTNFKRSVDVIHFDGRDRIGIWYNQVIPEENVDASGLVCKVVSDTDYFKDKGPYCDRFRENYQKLFKDLTQVSDLFKLHENGEIRFGKETYFHTALYMNANKGIMVFYDGNYIPNTIMEAFPYEDQIIIATHTFQYTNSFGKIDPIFD